VELVNLKDSGEVVSFAQAVKQGLGRNQGLFFPQKINKIDNIEGLLELDFVTRSSKILSHLIGDEIPQEDLYAMVKAAFDFPAVLESIGSSFYCLELFHGPTLAFKDFGARFMAQCLNYFSDDNPITILTATSGDTGAAVAHAFHGLDNINVVVLFPKGKISQLQEKLFTTLGGNIHTVSINADFDGCQKLVKDAFDDQALREGVFLNSANSINISRLVAQVCYYFEAIAQLAPEQRKEAVISVPSGNFGNLTAGMIAKAMGLPIKRFVAATNINDTVPRYLETQMWDPKPTQETLSNAMDVSKPNNWPRVEALIEQGYVPAECLSGVSIDEEYTCLAMHQLSQMGYISEPHAAIAFKGLKQTIQEDEVGIFLGTAHPAKFRESVENILGQPINLPATLAEHAGRQSLSSNMDADFDELRKYLFGLMA
jgi:threonine synthase